MRMEMIDVERLLQVLESKRKTAADVEVKVIKTQLERMLFDTGYVMAVRDVAAEVSRQLNGGQG